jgi:PAS domain S-box-containing protein
MRARPREAGRVSAWTWTHGSGTSDEVGLVPGSGSDPTLVVGPDGQVVDWNDAAAATFALCADDARGLNLPMLFAASEEAHVLALAERARAEQARDTLVALRGDGSRFVAEVTLRPLDAPSPGRASVLVARDATEQTVVHAACAAFAAARELPTALASFRTALEPVLTVAGLAISKLAGDHFQRAAGVGNPLRLPGPDLAAAFEEGAPVVVDRPIAGTGVGSYAVFPLFDGDRLFGTFDVGFERRDAASTELVPMLARATATVAPSVRNLLALETQADTIRRLGRQDTLKNEFLALVTHDIRTPTSVVAGFAETLRARWNELPEADKLECVDAILRSGRNLSHIVATGLDVALLESGEFRVSPQAFDVAGQIEQTVRDLASRDGRERIRLTIAEDLPAVSADRERHWRVLTNLISNAMKFSPPDEPIEIAVCERGGYVQVEVRDHGVGIGAAELPMLFRKFSRVGSRNGVPGSGLGLYICKRIVEAQGGRIWAESRRGEGTVFAYTLPVAEVAADGSRAPEQIVAVRERDGFRAAVEAQLPEDVLDVGGDGLRRDEERTSDLLLSETVGEQSQHVELAPGEI